MRKVEFWSLLIGCIVGGVISHFITKNSIKIEVALIVGEVLMLIVCYFITKKRS